MFRLAIALLGIIFIFAAGNCAYALSPNDNFEMSSDYMTIVNSQGFIILQTGLAVNPGDMYINENNRLYEITTIEGTLAKAHYIGDEDLSSSVDTDVIPTQASAEALPPLIAIYHTHTDESYIPTSGKSSNRGNGDVMQVGAALNNRLQELGYRTEHDKTLHEPHDANAYQRSRRTFMKLLGRQPSVLFDIHRDSAPLNVYKTTIDGQSVAKILLVVGRQNQNITTTKNFAKKIKAAADAKYKGLIRGIFIAHGNYNQDLNPHSMLVEIGTQYNSQEAAEKSAALFADVIPSILATGNTGTLTPTGDDNIFISPENIQYGHDILYITGLLILGSAIYLYLSTGSWKEIKRKLNRLRNYEFTNFLGSFKKRRK